MLKYRYSFNTMINKVIGSLTVLLALAITAYSIQLIITKAENAWPILACSSFAILVGVVIFRRGLGGVIKSVHDSTPPGMR